MKWQKAESSSSQVPQGAARIPSPRDRAAISQCGHDGHGDHARAAPGRRRRLRTTISSPTNNSKRNWRPATSSSTIIALIRIRTTAPTSPTSSRNSRAGKVVLRGRTDSRCEISSKNTMMRRRYFIMPPSLDAFEKRVWERSPMSDVEWQERLKFTADEVAHEAPWYDYRISNEDGKLDSRPSRKSLEFSRKKATISNDGTRHRTFFRLAGRGQGHAGENAHRLLEVEVRSRCHSYRHGAGVAQSA